MVEEGDDILLSGLLTDNIVSSTFMKTRTAKSSTRGTRTGVAPSMADIGETSKYLFEQVLEKAHFGGID